VDVSLRRSYLLRASLAVVSWVSVATLVTGCAGQGQLSGASTVDMAFVRAAPTWDLDRDGVVTCDEWKLYATQLFAEADTGNKGYLTLEDFAILVKTDHLFEAADFAYFGGSSTGRVTRAAFVDKPNPAFRLLDKRKDCRLTSEELRLAYRAADARRMPTETRRRTG
jgi:Ca2+-binding EF-hand superfamily protein